jgi:hypothetical protein
VVPAPRLAEIKAEVKQGIGHEINRATEIRTLKGRKPASAGRKIMPFSKIPFQIVYLEFKIKLILEEGQGL